jgi:AcrR family transcriptional regulator
MDNASRSERSRKAALQAALTIIARDGPGRLTLDAIARESGMSKGGLTHQFPTKEAVLKALLEHQSKHFEDFSRRYLAKAETTTPQPYLAAQIATLRETIGQPDSVAFAILGAMNQDPSLLAHSRDIEARNAEAIKTEADDPQLAMLRWNAAKGLALSAMFGLTALPDEECKLLFDRLLDDQQWSALAKAPPARAGRARKTKRG